MENHINPDSRFQIGTYMLLWFTNPDKIENEQGLCTEFFTSLKDAEKLAELLSGSRIILMCTTQNPSPDNNAYWSAIKFYGESFELNELTILSSKYHQEFLKIRDLKNYLNKVKENQLTIDIRDLVQRYGLDQNQVRYWIDNILTEG